MITTLLILGVALFSSFGVLILQAAHAPKGQEDENGFHFDEVAVPQWQKARVAYRVDADHAHAAVNHIPAT